MPKDKRRRKGKKGFSFNAADIALIGIFALAAIISYFNLQNPVYTLLLGLAGALIAIENIKKNEEVTYMIAVATLIIVIGAISLVSVPVQVTSFLANIAVAFGISGLIVALGTIVKLSWEKR